MSYLVLQVQLQRERLELSPVYSTAMQHGGHTTGYIRLVNFSQKAAPEMRHAIAELQVPAKPFDDGCVQVSYSLSLAPAFDSLAVASSNDLFADEIKSKA